MPNHVRQQIREAVGNAVSGLSLTGTRVFQSRVYPLESADLPGLLVRTQSENIAYNGIGLPRFQERTLRIEVVAVAKATDNLDDTLDTICRDVETALAMPCAALAGICSTIGITDTEVELAGTSDKPTGQATMAFEVLYQTTANAPDVALT